MPQIAQIGETWISQAFWLLLFFGLLYFGLAKTLLPRIGHSVERRAAKIAGDLEAAQAARDRAEEAGVAREAELAHARAEAQARAADAKAAGSKAMEARLRAQQAELEGRLAAEEARVAAARAKALAGLDEVAAAAVSDIVRKLVGVDVGSDVALSAVRGANG